MIHGEMDVHLNGQSLHHHHFITLNNLPLVRGLDPYWIEKMEGKKGMTPAEPLGDIHMPNTSFIPFMISFGLFIAAFGAMYHVDDKAGQLPVLIIGLVITFGSMFLRSVKDDHGFHIHKEDLMMMMIRGLRHNAC